MTNEENLEEELVEIEQPDDAPPGTKPEEQLQAIIDAAKTTRMTPEDEARAVELLKQTIPGGPKAITATLDAILALPWSSGVKAVTEAWPETKPAGRARLLAGLGKIDGDVSRRIRLSLARGLHAQDPAAALKLITSVCEAMGGALGGSSTKDRQIFANVMLGKARPWIMNISMTEMKPADAQKLITPSLESCAQAPIFTQIWVLRWICDSDKFDTLPPEHIESIGKSINRWQGRWHKELRKIIPKLPDSLEAALSTGPARQPAPLPVQEPAPAPAPTYESDQAEPAATGEEGQEELPLDDEDDEDADDLENEAQPAEPRPAPAQRPQRDQQQQRGGRDRDRDRDRGPFDLTRSLRDIEGYVARLRSELTQAQAAARRGDRGDRGDRGRGRSQGPAASSEELEELRRFNGQLEEQNQELRHRIEELTSDHEDRAATLELGDSLQQFKHFLGLKLKEDYADYSAISREALNEVVRRHAHEILGRIFAVLQAEGVRFDQEE